jgi:radical S-adenosyl methionine domain-containing protein 2
MFKINTVVTSVNAEESMYEFINEVKPMRWKIFQVLPIKGENCGDAKHPKKDVLPFIVSDDNFQKFVERNQENLFDPTIMKVENNAVMKDSYILIDEYGRLLDCTNSHKTPSESILDVGLEAASRTLLGETANGFRRDLFHARGGYYPESWSK